LKYATPVLFEPPQALLEIPKLNVTESVSPIETIAFKSCSAPASFHVNRVKRLPPSGSEEKAPAVGKLPVVVFSKVQPVSLTQLVVLSVLVPYSVSKFPFRTGMVVCADASGAPSPMAAMARPQSLRRGRKFPGMIAVLGRDVVFMVVGYTVLFS